MKGLRITITVVAAAFAATSAIAQGQKVTINYGLATFLPTTAPIFSVPKRAGFWSQDGLDVTIEGGSGAIQQLAAKRVAMTFTNTLNGYLMREAGGPVKIVANVYTLSPFFPVALADGPVKSIKDFKGKTIGCLDMKSSCVPLLKAMVQAEGLDPEKDITIVGAGEGVTPLHALQTGRIAAFMSFEAQYALLETQGAKFIRFNDNPVIKNLSFTQGLIVHEDTIREDPKVVEGLLRGIAKAMVFSTENPEAAIQLHWKQFPLTRPTGVDETRALRDAVFVLKSQLGLVSSAMTGTWGYATPAQIDAMSEFLYKNGIIKSVTAPDSYYTDRFLKAANTFDHDAIRKMAREYRIK